MFQAQLNGLVVFGKPKKLYHLPHNQALQGKQIMKRNDVGMCGFWAKMKVYLLEY